MRSPLAILKCLRADENGASAVEFGLLSTVLLLIVMGMVDLGIGIFHKMELTSAARAGAQYAVLKGYDSSTLQTVVQGSTNLSSVSVASSRFCECSTGVTPTGTAPSCTCSTGTVRKFITVTASYSYVPIFAKFKASYALSEAVTVREE
jgi:Flp pilus assembly protein TadG